MHSPTCSFQQITKGAVCLVVIHQTHKVEKSVEKAGGILFKPQESKESLLPVEKVFNLHLGAAQLYRDAAFKKRPGGIKT